MAYCSSCGAQMKPEQRFCVQCGKPNSIPSATSFQQQPNPIPVEPAIVRQPQVDVAGLQARLTISSKELGEAKAEIEDLKSKLEDKTRQYTIVANEHNELRKQVSTLNQELANSKERFDNRVDSQAEDLKRKLEGLEQQVNDQKKEIHSQRLTIDNLSVQLSNAKAIQATAAESVMQAKNNTDPNQASAKGRAWLRLLIALITLGALVAGGWFYYDNFLNGSKKLAAAEEAMLLHDWPEALLQIGKAEDIDVDMVFSLTNTERLYLDSLTRFIVAAKGDADFLRESFKNGNIGKLTSIKFMLGKLESWPAQPKTQQFGYFQNPTGRLLEPFSNIADSVYLVALELFSETGQNLVGTDGDYYIKGAAFDYSANQLVANIKGETNKLLAIKKVAALERVESKKEDKTTTPVNVGEPATKPTAKKPTLPTDPPASQLPTVAEIKADLIGKSISDWRFNNLSEFQSFKIVSKRTTGNSTLFNIEAIIKDPGGDMYKARFDTYYTKTAQGEWKFSKVVQTYFDYQ